MAIWQSFWPQFWYQTMIPKKEKKEELQSRMFPWLDDWQSKRLIETVDKLGITDTSEKLKKQQEIYKEVLPWIKAKEAQMNRQVIKNEQYNATLDTKDTKQKAVKMAGLKMEDLADMIKEKYDLDPNAPTDWIISEYNTMLNDMWIDEKLVEDYMNGKSDELLYVSWLKEDTRWWAENKSVLWVAENVVGWAYDSATGLPRFLATNLAKGVGWIAEKLWADEDKVQELVDSYIDSLKDFSWEAMWADTESGLYKGTKMVWDIAQIANPAWLGKAGIKAGQVAAKIGKEWSLIAKVAKWATQAAVDTAIMMPQSEQRLATGGELALWATIWGAMPLVWAAYKKWKEAVGKLWQKIYAKTIKLNPSQIKKIMKPNIAWVEPERWMLDRKISGNLSQVQSKLDDIADTSYKTLNSKVASVPWEFKSEAGDKILNALKKKVTGVEWLEEVASNIDDMLNKWQKWYSLKDIFSIKRLLDKRIKLYSSSGDPVTQETVEWLRNLREQLRKNIDDISASAGLDDIRTLSKEIQVANEISNSLENTIARESKNRAMSLTDLLVWWTLAWWVYAGTGDPRDTIKVVWGALITKKVLENPAVRTKIAIALDKLAPKAKQELTEAIINKSPISEATKNLVNKIISQLWVKTLSSKK